MWSERNLEQLGLDLDPRVNSFTYTYPPPHYAAKNAEPLPHSEVLSKLAGTDVSLYLHFPFCRQDCQYCSLHRVIPSSSREIDDYLEALKNEIRLVGSLCMRARVSSLYIGGGTPSLMRSHTVAKLADTVADAFQISDDCEFSMECVPQTDRTVVEWQEYFVPLVSRTVLPLTRVSLGIESLEPAVLKHMRRNGDRDAVINSLRIIDSLFTTYNVDFLLGYQIDRLWSVSEEIAAILKSVKDLRREGFRIPSVSIYQLWDTDSIPCSKNPEFKLPSSSELTDAKYRLQNTLYAEGYTYSPGTTFLASGNQPHQWTLHRCTEFRHIGIGSGAYSILPDHFVQRQRNIVDYVQKYMSSANRAVPNMTYYLSGFEKIIRYLILGLRSCNWISMPDLDCMSREPHIEEILGKIDKLTKAGILESRHGSIRLDSDYFMLTNEISSYLHPSDVPRKSHYKQ